MSNLQLINAPAGSGKSTEIKRMVREWSAEHPFDRLLCVTYTNRAADELKADISSPYIDVSTIHTFFNGFARSLFSAPEIVSHYFDVYGDDIKARIDNADESMTTEESNARYRETLGDPLTFELVRDSVRALYYNERPFNTLYRGGLCHDDLLAFVASCAERYPNIYRRVSAKYRRVIIDEYQDTDVNVLDFFLRALKDTRVGLHLYGDRMQQIYKSDPERFHALRSQFEVQKRKVVNYRSTSAIVSALNAIYNDETLQQVANSNAKGTAPRVHFTNTPDRTVEQIANADTLILSVHNSSIFGAIGSLELFKSLQAMPDHGYNSRYPAATVLMEPEWERAQNPLLRLLYGLLEIEASFIRGHIGTAIKTLRSHSKDFGDFAFHVHSDKIFFSTQLDALFASMRKADATIKDVLHSLSSLEVEQAADISGYLENEEYNKLVLVPFQQVRAVFEFRSSPTRSTQHGVKGESHEKVVFVAETSSSPIVKMKKLFDLWPDYDLNLDMLEALLAQLSGAFHSAKVRIGVDISKLKALTFPPLQESITAEAKKVADTFKGSPLFSELYGSLFDAYLSKPGVTNAKKLFSMSEIEGLLSAYRLFYVGCSRARSELDIVIPLKEVNDVNSAAEKFRELGFEVAEMP